MAVFPFSKCRHSLWSGRIIANEVYLRLVANWKLFTCLLTHIEVSINRILCFICTWLLLLIIFCLGDSFLLLCDVVMCLHYGLLHWFQFGAVMNTVSWYIIVHIYVGFINWTILDFCEMGYAYIWLWYYCQTFPKGFH